MKKEKEIFKGVVGYSEIKQNLLRLIDVLNNESKYKEIGSSIPKGLLIYGPPGTGKTTFSNIIMDNVNNRKKYIVRKTKADGSFIDYMNNIFEDAKKNSPAIILLDDLDKFADEPNPNEEEYVAVQSFIDDVKDDDIFVIATANSIHTLPKSLKRSGRFDIRINVDDPSDEDSLEIIKYYLGKKKLEGDVNIKNISYILEGASCAEVETVCNNAGILSGYLNKKRIGMEELIRASLEYRYDTYLEDMYKEDEYSLNISYHEAGHALIGILLEPNSVDFVTTVASDSTIGGVTIYSSNKNYFKDIKYMINRVKSLLGGKAASEIVYHTTDVGCNDDLNRAFDVARRFSDNYCMKGFGGRIQNSDETSEKVKETTDYETTKIIEKYYDEVKELLLKNRSTLDALAFELNKKKILFKDEINEIIYRSLNNKKEG
jgi:cell division protease FtsH